MDVGLWADADEQVLARAELEDHVDDVETQQDDCCPAGEAEGFCEFLVVVILEDKIELMTGFGIT